MYQESIQDFLNIPGVLAVGLIQEQLKLYLHLKDQTLGWKEKQTLTQSIQQKLAKIPKKVELFEFQVSDYYGYTYALSYNSTLLVLTSTEITKVRLRDLAAKQLKTILQKDIDTTIATFKLLTDKKPQTRVISTTATIVLDGQENNYKNEPIEIKISTDDLVKALNQLSQFSSNFLGKKITANYLHSTRPHFDWLDNFRITNSAEITFSGIFQVSVNALQHQQMKDWTAAFIKQCSQIIQDLPMLIEQKGLNERNKSLLLTTSSGQLKKHEGSPVYVDLLKK